ncbi:2-C-methyl-D-erythritol 4-phosphate cytidylyltransferase [Candidatus Woesearchaeota archaeon]|nr:2-C-methyl-D-erythritol 4-phosphate cytidylyltransferase [Candidatus Woesearchaeota archaeon]
MNFAIIVAAGKSRRMKKSINKVFLPLISKPMIYYTIKNFQECNLIDEIIVVAQKNDIKKINEIKQEYNFNKIKKIAEGGIERQDSVHKGLISIKNAKNDDVIVVHNGSSPLVKENEIVECINAAKKYGAAVSGFPLKDTIKKISNDFVEKTIDRKDIYQVQTPQAIQYGLFIEAFKNAKKKNLKVTDDVSLVEALGKKVKIVPCSYENIKITTYEDLKIAEAILMKRNNAGFRIGFGQDNHRFSNNKNKKLILGGYILPDEKGLEADSDGDVILHALFNAISTAIGERSLGYYSDEMCRKGIADSKEYLKVILNKLKQKNLELNNVSIMIEASKPKLEPHTNKIKDSLSKILKLEKERIGIAYTSGEKLTAFGRGEGIQGFAAITLRDNI